MHEFPQIGQEMAERLGGLHIIVIILLTEKFYLDTSQWTTPNTSMVMAPYHNI